MANAGQGGGGQSAYKSSIATLTGQNSATGIDPIVEVSYTSAEEGAGNETVTTNITVSGATTPNLTLSADSVTTSTVKCRISHPAAVLNSADANGDTILSDGTLSGGLVTKTAEFEVISAVNRTISDLNFEVVNDKDSSVYSSGSQNLFLNDIDFQTNDDDTDPLVSGRTFVLYPPDENVSVKITMGASAGFGHNGNARGKGGVTVFTYTLQKNTEYVFKLGTTVSPPTSLGRGGAGAFFYEKGRLLVACGGGGASGWFGGAGGDGGGAGVAGSSGGGSSGGDGGQSVAAGQLPAEGEVPTGGVGGKVESCTSGDYWLSQGVDPCVDVGNVKFRTFDGTEVSSSATIQRGYKGDGAPENGFRFNGGSSFNEVNGTYVGGGGAGAYGGSAAASTNSGGGGGSGYTNGSVNIISTSSENETYSGFAQIELL